MSYSLCLHDIVCHCTRASQVAEEMNETLDGFAFSRIMWLLGSVAMT